MTQYSSILSSKKPLFGIFAHFWLSFFGSWLRLNCSRRISNEKQKKTSTQNTQQHREKSSLALIIEKMQKSGSLWFQTGRPLETKFYCLFTLLGYYSLYYVTIVHIYTKIHVSNFIQILVFVVKDRFHHSSLLPTLLSPFFFFFFFIFIFIQLDFIQFMYIYIYITFNSICETLTSFLSVLIHIHIYLSIVICAYNFRCP